MKKSLAKFKRAVVRVRDFLDEKTIGSVNCGPVSRLHRFAHFWLLVGKSFSRNRCPLRASALAYTTLLALIPMMFVAVSVSSSILKKEGGQRINRLIDNIIVNLTPGTSGSNNPALLSSPATGSNELAGVISPTGTNAPTMQTNTADSRMTNERQELVRAINDFIARIQSGTLGVTGIVLLVFVAISMLTRVESTFNDIWGVTRGRTWVARVVHYWAVITLGPLLLTAALSLGSGRHLDSSRRLLHSMPMLGGMVLQLLSLLILCLTFASFYMSIPNTKVYWRAALVGGLVGGILWHLNNYFSVLYVSRWVTNSKIYGSLAVIPVVMVGLYFSWLIVLFGAQVSYAFQNRAAYLQEKQAENVNQRGREFIALRLMEYIGQRFLRGERPATVPELSEGLVVPTRLVQHIMNTLLLAQLVVEVTGVDTAYAPARPLENISCHDILLALRAGQGQELTTREDAARAEVYGEFERILQAEQKAASAVTVLAMVNRTEKLAALPGKRLKAVTEGETD